MSTIDKLSPDSSPGKVSKKAGVRRVNNMPLFLMLGAAMLFLAVMAMVAYDRSAKSQAASHVELKGGDSSRMAKDIAGDRTDGVVPPAISLDSPPLAKPINLDLPPAPPAPPGGFEVAGSPAAPIVDENERQIRMSKLARLDEAARAKTSVNSRAANSKSDDVPRTREEIAARIAAATQQAERARATDPTTAYRARLAQLQSDGLIPTSASGVGGVGGGQRVNGVDQFAGNGQGDRWRLDSAPDAPRTKFELRAGFVIPATLISGINSELPGQIFAQVSQDVYDTATGKYKLIPQGSRLFGSYSSEIIYGQSRILVGWQRIIFPDGKAMDIGSMPGADSAGYAGFTDQTNNHYVRVFGSAFLMSGIIAGITYSQKSNQVTSVNQQQTASSALSEALGQQLGQTTALMITKNLNLAPTLEVRPGYRFNVIVTKDLTFSKPYASFDY